MAIASKPPTRARQFQYRGDLAETPLPEILARAARFEVPGVMEAVQEDVTTEVYVRDAQIVHARSSDLSTSLGAYLRRVGRLSQQQFRQVMRERRQATDRLGVLLVESGIMTPDEVHAAIRRQTEAIVWSLFSWWEGSVTFRLGRWDSTHMIAIQLPVRRAIIDGIKRESNARQLIGRIGGRDTVLEPSFSVEDCISLGLEAEDFELLSMIDGRRTLRELCAGGPGTGASNAKVLYAMFVLDLVKLVPVGASGTERRVAAVRNFRRADGALADAVGSDVASLLR